MNRRIAVVLCLGLLLATALVAFLPSSTDRASCGWWGSPEWGEGESRALAERYVDLAEQSAELPDGFDTTSESAASGALGVAENYRRCDAALDTRRTFTFILLGLAVATPVGVIYVGGKRED